MTSQYEYLPLPIKSHQAASDNLQEGFIRLLDILPGDYSSDIVVDLQPAPCRGQGDPKYKALSYVWGSTENPAIIYVGPEKRRTLRITQNLAIALRHLRDQHEQRTLWIDAICIDQSNLSERSSQVSMMGSIYRFAEETIVWLGPEADDSAHGMHLLEKLSSKVEARQDTQDLKPTAAALAENDLDWADQDTWLPYDERDRQALSCLMHRPWFERLWIRQEIFLSSTHATVQCGHTSMTWGSFINAFSVVFRKSWYKDEIYKWYASHWDRFYLMSSLSDEQKFSLKDIGTAFRRASCSDPRDRIYAILNLLNPAEENLGIVSNYDWATEDVYKDAVLRFVSIRRDLSILCDIKLRNTLRGPSWVPDWATEDGVSGLDRWRVNFQASGPLMANTTSALSPDVLRVSGVRLGSIQEILSEITEQLTDQRALGALRRLVPPDVTNLPYVGGGTLLMAYTRCMLFDRFRETHYPPLHKRMSLQEGTEALETIVSSEDENLEGLLQTLPVHSFLHWVRTYMSGLLFRTGDGHIGWCPSVAQPGDEVCVIIGCEWPMLLRKDERLQHQVVGACYLTGYMHGESVLGPLPSHYSCVGFLNETVPGRSEYCIGYLASHTGEVQAADPRIQDLGVEDAEDYRQRCEREPGARVDMKQAELDLLQIGIQYFDLI